MVDFCFLFSIDGWAGNIALRLLGKISFFHTMRILIHLILLILMASEGLVVVAQGEPSPVIQRLELIDAKTSDGEMMDSVDELRKIAAAASVGKDWEVWVYSLNLQARLATISQRYKLAIALLDSSLVLSESRLPQPNRHSAQAHNNLGYCLQAVGKPGAAVQQIEQALAMRIELFGEAHADVAQSYFILSVVLGKEGDFEQEKVYLEKTMDLTAELYGPDSFEMYQPYINMGVWHSGQGDLLAAQGYYERALELCRAHFESNNYMLAHSYNNLGNLLVRRGANREAMVYLRRALDINKELRPGTAAINWSNIGNCHLALKEYDAAREAYARSLDLEAELFGRDYPYRAITYMYQARAFRLLGEEDQAMKNLDRAEEILEKAPPRFGQHKGKLSMLRAEVLYERGAAEEARALYRQGVEVLDREVGIKHTRTLNELLQFARMEEKHGSEEVAQEMLEECRRRLFSGLEAGAGGNRYTWPLQREIDLLLAELHFKEDKDNEMAWKHVQGAIACADSMRTHLSDDASQILIADEGMPMFELGLEICHALFQSSGDERMLSEMFAIMDKSKSFVLSRNLRNAAGTRGGLLPDSLALRERALKSGLARYDELLGEVGESGEKKRRWDSTRVELRNAYSDFCRMLEEDYPKYYALRFHTGGMDLEELREELGKGEMLVEYFEGARNWYVMGVEAGGARLAVVPREAGLDSLLLQLRKALASPPSYEASASENWSNFTVPAFSLFQSLLQPIFTTSPPQKLIVVPDGPLAHLPFEILLDSPPPPSDFSYVALPYLFRSMDVRYLNAAHLLVGQQGEVGFEKGLLAFAPTFDGGGEYGEREAPGPLSNTLVEVEMAQDALPGSPFVGRAATESRFKAHASDFQVLHLATHALVDDSVPQRSGLLFSLPDSVDDGFLHGWELLEMDLKAELAVLSACNTGMGKMQRGEGVMSLARDFRLAGCPSVVMSLWNASDRSTAELMGEMYGELKKGRGKNEALRKAKLEYLSKVDPLRAHPHFWAGFVLIGDASPLTRNSAPLWPWILLGLAGLLIWWSYRRD